MPEGAALVPRGVSGLVQGVQGLVVEGWGEVVGCADGVFGAGIEVDVEIAEDETDVLACIGMTMTEIVEIMVDVSTLR